MQQRITANTRAYNAINCLVELSKENTKIAPFVNDGQLMISYLNPKCDMLEDKLFPIEEPFALTNATYSKKYELHIDDFKEGILSKMGETMLAAILDTLREKLNREFIDDLKKHIGKQANGNDWNMIPPVIDDETMNPVGFYEIQRAFMQVGLEAPAIMGGESAYNMKYLLKKDNIYYDGSLSYFADDKDYEHTIAIAPNALKLVTYSMFAKVHSFEDYNKEDYYDLNFKMTEDRAMSAIYDPLSKMLIDVNIDKEPERWVMQVGVKWGIFYTPIESSIEGVTGIMHFKSCRPYKKTCD